MRKNITIKGVEVPFESNLGTARLYQKFTGQDLLKTLVGKKDELKTMNAALDIFDIYQKLAYVMNVQATHSDIKEMIALMNDDDFLAWTFQFDSDAFNEETLQEIASFWSGQMAASSQPKNA